LSFEEIDVANCLTDLRDGGNQVLITRELLIDYREDAAKTGDLLHCLVVHGGVVLDGLHPAVHFAGHFFNLGGVAGWIENGPLGLCWLRRGDDDAE
jgi:hypothetical protein